MKRIISIQLFFFLTPHISSHVIFIIDVITVIASLNVTLTQINIINDDYHLTCDFIFFLFGFPFMCSLK